MRTVVSVLQIIVALGLLNVWLLRFRQSTTYRGGNAKTMQEEFAVYGLPEWSMWVVGALKVAVALCLIAGLWFHFLVLPAALLLCVLMVGALAMHLKVHDPIKKSLPALGMLISAALIGLASTR